MNANLQDYSHKRFNILTGEWVLVSPQRAKRPWQGQNETVSNEERPIHDPNCYLCPGNKRINGEQNPDYKDVHVFTNDFAALQTTTPEISEGQGLIKAEGEQGICKVICFSPDHSKSLANMSILEIENVVALWIKESKELGSKDFINYVQIFENKGAVMGCSNPHPHGQIWSQSSLPNEIIKKDNNQFVYFKEQRKSILKDYLEQEIKAKERIILENDSFVILVPFWAVWPYEIMIVPKTHKPNIAILTKHEQTHFSEAISVITKTYDKIFNCSFPYSSGIHQAPTNNRHNEHWHWHMSFYPPLLRNASVKKFMVGYEMFGMPQRDISPESAAEIIRKNL